MSEVAQEESHKNKHTPNKQEVVAHRRELVARYRIRGLTMREIVERLAEEYPNPQTGEPFVLSTVKDDCHALDREWRERTAASMDEHKARVYQELQAVKRAGWNAEDLGVVLRALKQEAVLLGLAAPRQVDINFLRNKARELAERLGVPVSDILQQAEAVAARAAGAEF